MVGVAAADDVAGEVLVEGAAPAERLLFCCRPSSPGGASGAEPADMAEGRAKGSERGSITAAPEPWRGPRLRYHESGSVHARAAAIFLEPQAERAMIVLSYMILHAAMAGVPIPTPPFRKSKHKRRRASRGASCAWTCGMGVSDFRRLGAAERAVWPVLCTGSAAPWGWILGPELNLTRH